MNKTIFVIEIVRNDSRDEHSYTAGAFEDELDALTEAWEHIKMRAGKYGAIVMGFTLNSSEIVYQRKLSSWEAFTSSCKQSAEEIKKRLKLEDIE